MVELDSEQKGILKYLTIGSEDAVSLNDISKYLDKQGYDNTSIKDIREDMELLADKGYVRSKVMGSGKNREERFYLSKFIGAGNRKQKTLQGRGWFGKDLVRLIERLSGAFFFVFGLGALVYEGSILTGAVISSREGVAISSFLGFALLVVGGFLFKKSLKK